MQARILDNRQPQLDPARALYNHFILWNAILSLQTASTRIVFRVPNHVFLDPQSRSRNKIMFHS